MMTDEVSEGEMRGMEGEDCRAGEKNNEGTVK